MNFTSTGARALEQCLRQLPEAQVSVDEAPLIAPSVRPDAVAHIFYHGQQTTLIAEIKQKGEPQRARLAIYQLQHHLKSVPNAIGVFIAPYISLETANLCREEHVGYLDLAGNCHIEFNDVYIHIEGKQNPFATSRPLRTLYQPKAERVLRVLLTDHPAIWRIQALANAAEVSIGHVYKVKELLLEKEWATETKQGIALTKPLTLLSAWSKEVSMDSQHSHNNIIKVVCIILSRQKLGSLK